MNAPLGPKTVSFTSASHPPMSSVVNRSFDRRQGVGRLGGLRRVDRPRVRRAREDVLRFLRVEVLHELVGDVLDAMRLGVLVDDDGGGPDLDGGWRLDELFLASSGLRGCDLVVVRDRDIAVARLEVLERVVGALVHHRDVLEDALEQALSVSGVVPRIPGHLTAHRRPVRRHDVPPRAARLRGVGREDLEAGLRQVVPVLDVLRVPGTNGEDHGPGLHGRAVRGVLPNRS